MNLIGCGRDGISSQASPSGRRVSTEARVSVFKPVPSKPPATTYTYKRLDCWNWQALHWKQKGRCQIYQFVTVKKVWKPSRNTQTVLKLFFENIFARASLINICLLLLFLSGLTPVGVAGRIAHAWALLFDGSFGSSSTKPSKLYLQVECIS